MKLGHFGVRLGHFFGRTVSIVIILFFFACLFRILYPAILEMPDRRKKEATRREILALWDCLNEYKNSTSENRFPTTLNSLSGAELVKRGLGDSETLSAKYWYLPSCEKLKGYDVAPLLIEKPSHYTRYDGGFVANSEGRIAFFYLGDTYREFLKQFAK